MSSDIAIKIENLTKVFYDFWRRPKAKAVDNVSLDIYKGRIFGLLGPNGSGKSTILKVLLGLLYPTTGMVRVLDRSPQSVKVKQSIGYLPEESYLYGYLTPRETLDFYGRLFDLDRESREKRVVQLLDMVGLTQVSDRRVGEFSKGMARRVGLAQALINDPQLVLLDEPTAGLDPMGCRQVKDLMLTLAGRGKTVVLCSHLLADVEDVCDNVAILYDGRVRAQGRMKELLVKQDSVRITVPSLTGDSMKKLLNTIRKQSGSEPQVDHPSMNLEQFFLEVIEDARKSGDTTSGASGTEDLAEYLKCDPSDVSKTGDR